MSERLLTSFITMSSLQFHKRPVSHFGAYLYSQVMVGRLLKTIDLERFQVFQERYRMADPRPNGYSKYLDLRRWMAIALWHCARLGLHRSRPLQILDIGTGAGYFPYVCSFYGHKVVALDLDIIPMYNEICAFLNVDRRTWRVEKGHALPDLGMKFDLLTAFMIKFNNHPSSNQWSADEWRFMLADLKTNQCAENGRLVLSFNSNADGRFYDDASRALFASAGGEIYGRHVDFRVLRNPPPGQSWCPESAPWAVGR